MDNFIVSARKYRPVTFESVVGQNHITNTLKNAIKTNQLAQAFLFCGPRGVGKTTCARILAKTINCQQSGQSAEPCGTCESCQSFQNGTSFSIHELDAASNNSVEDIRNLTEQVRIPPQTGKYKIYIIDEVHMLSSAAFNAFLKTLEEPPPYAIFILATTEKHKIIPTILSRCQIFDFNRIKVEDMAQHLAAIAQKEGIEFEAEGLHIIAQKADGGLRDALSMFDQLASFSNRNISYKAVIENLNILDYDYYFQLAEALLAQQAAKSLLIFDEILNKGFDGNHFIIGLASHFRNLLVAQDPSTTQLLEVSEGIRTKYLAQTQQTTASFLVSALSVANQCDLNYRSSKNQRLQVELALIKLAHLPSVLNLSSFPETEEVKKKQVEPVTVAETPISILQKQEIVAEKVEIAPAATAPEPVVEESPIPEQAPKPEVVAEIPSRTPSIAPEVATSINLVAPSTLIPNLNEWASAAVLEEKKPEYLTGNSAESVTQEMLLNRWRTYCEQVKKDGKINLFTLLNSGNPTLSDGHLIEFTLENKIQEELLLHERVDLLNFLRTDLNNFQLELKTIVAEQTEGKRLYTSTEKYEYMVEKNPAVEEFRKTFNLDLEL
ncbi:MAG: DNA polymerase III subunit gamma/tau [Sphingobacteriaceae bacterium]|nr:DNA polymerase III subunit gamma/tau [Sphingobacteriaceae bacterium]